MTVKLSFKELAVRVLQETGEPMNPKQMWDFAVQRDWHKCLKTFDEKSQTFTGKTPDVTFCRDVYKNKTVFEYVLGSKPKQFRLKNTDTQAALYEQASSKAQALPNIQPQDKAQHPAIPHPTPKAKNTSFSERDLHPVLCTFLRQSSYFNAYAKTIFHETSIKTTKGADRWLYPDVVAVNLEYENYKTDVSEFIKRFAILPIKVFSFEIKKELNFGNYKESFFQAVSNSSWANEGYLVSHKFPKDKQFIKALQKLSQSFGIGVIQLNLENISQSQILFPAKFKEKMDYATIGELAEKNANFSEFLKAITHPSSDFLSKFDTVLEGDRLTDYLIRLRG